MHTRLCKTQLLNITAVNIESLKIKSHVETTRSSETEKNMWKTNGKCLRTQRENSNFQFKCEVEVFASFSFPLRELHTSCLGKAYGLRKREGNKYFLRAACVPRRLHTLPLVDLTNMSWSVIVWFIGKVTEAKGGSWVLAPAVDRRIGFRTLLSSSRAHTPYVLLRQPRKAFLRATTQAWQGRVCSFLHERKLYLYTYWLPTSHSSSCL